MYDNACDDNLDSEDDNNDNDDYKIMMMTTTTRRRITGGEANLSTNFWQLILKEAIAQKVWFSHEMAPYFSVSRRCSRETLSFS